MELLGRIGLSYTTDLRAFLDLLVSLLRIDDSWQSERIACALKGKQSFSVFPSKTRTSFGVKCSFVIYIYLLYFSNV